MKKLFLSIIVISIIMLSGCKHLTPYNGPIFNGKDYIFTNVGSTLNYKRISLDQKSEIKIQITVQNCNDNKTKCSYINKVINENGKVEDKYSTNYSMISGALSMIDKFDPKGTIVLPADIELNKVQILHNNEVYGQIPEKFIVTQVIPEITVNGNQYKNCIEITFETITPLKYRYLKLITKSIECKHIGTVKKEMNSYDKDRTNQDINNSPFIFSGTYIDTLTSISQDKNK